MPSQPELHLALDTDRLPPVELDEAAPTSLARSSTPSTPPSAGGQRRRASDRETPLLQDPTDSPSFTATERHLTASVLNLVQGEPVDAVSFTSTVSQLTEQNLQNFTAQDQREVLIGQLYRLAWTHRNQVQRFGPEVPDQERQLLDGEQQLLNMLYEKSVRYIRANNEMSARYLFRHTILSGLLTMTTLICAAAISSPVPLAVAMVSSLLASLINALQNYSQLTRLAHRHREAAQNWEELRRAIFSLFDTRTVRAPNHRIAAVARAYESAMAQNPVLPLRLEQQSLKDNVRRLLPSETPLEPSGPRESLSKKNIEFLLNEMDSVEYCRRSITRRSLQLQHIDFFAGMFIAMAMVGSTSGSIAVFLREDLQWVKYVVRVCSSIVTAAGTLLNAQQPGTKAQQYLHVAHEASEWLCRAEELLYCGPHLRMAQRVGELRRQCDTLLSNMRQQGLWHMDPDVPPERVTGLVEQSPMDIGSLSHHSIARSVSLPSRPGSQGHSRRSTTFFRRACWWTPCGRRVAAAL